VGSPVFSSQMFTKRSKKTPGTWLTGDLVRAVAAAAWTADTDVAVFWAEAALTRARAERMESIVKRLKGCKRMLSEKDERVLLLMVQKKSVICEGGTANIYKHNYRSCSSMFPHQSRLGGKCFFETESVTNDTSGARHSPC